VDALIAHLAHDVTCVIAASVRDDHDFIVIKRLLESAAKREWKKMRAVPGRYND